jgi:alpha-tubulin suppressor-like RCC1 family protein
MKKSKWLLAPCIALLTLVSCGGGTPAPTIENLAMTTSSPTTVSGSSQVVFAEVNGTGAFNKAVTWSSSAGSFLHPTGSVNRFTAPTVTSNTNVTITATSVADPGKTDTNLIVVTPIAASSSITAVTTSATSSTLNAAASTDLTAVVAGTSGFSNAVNWSIVSGTGTLSSASGSSISFTAPSLATASTTIVRATSVQDSSKSGVLSLSIGATTPGSSVTGVTVTAASTNVAAGSSTALTAGVTGLNGFGDGVIWSVVSGAGSLSAVTGSSITFTAPSLATSSTTIVRATSVQNPSKTADVTINITAVTAPSSSITGVSIAASRVALRESENTTLIASVSGGGAFNKDVIWAIEAPIIGSLSSTTGNTVLYQAPSSSVGRVVRITASSVQDGSKSKTIFVSVNPVKASISASGSHSLALKSDGTMLSWGNDNYGQLGDGTIGPNNPTPSAVLGASNIVAIAAGGAHSLALKSDGTMLSWGNDNYGQLGDSTIDPNNPTPSAVLGASNIVAIAAGGVHSLALKSDGTILSWGRDDLGQLGDGTVDPSNPTPSAVLGATNIVGIVAGGAHSLALKSDGTMLSWGYNVYGQLGNGTAGGNNPTPSAVLGATNIVGIVAGGVHSLALKSDGTMLSWGSNSSVQLGDGTAGPNNPTPSAVLGATNIVGIAAGSDHSLALKSDGTILSWGYDNYGQLGDGTAFPGNPTPSAVLGATNIVGIAAGFGHSLALKSDGTMLSWGYDASGQLGDGTVGPDANPTPTEVLLGLFTIRLP